MKKHSAWAWAGILLFVMISVFDRFLNGLPAWLRVALALAALALVITGFLKRNDKKR